MASLREVVGERGLESGCDYSEFHGQLVGKQTCSIAVRSGGEVWGQNVWEKSGLRVLNVVVS